MRNYGTMKATLSLLEDVQKTLLDKRGRADDEVEQREQEFKGYKSFLDEDGIRRYQKEDKDGLIEDCDRWTYEYREEQLTEAKQYRDAIDALIKYLDNYKL